MSPSAVRVAPETVSTSADCAASISSSKGSAFGFGDVIRVSVTIQNGKMTDLAVLDASGEDKPYYKQALPLLDEMLAVQSAGVDTVSGATLTAEGLIGAVENALGKAAE